jgi:D-sedoheptulose 7-phosphate isomerase
MRPGDVVIAISVHGGKGADKAGAWSQNLLRAVHYAKEHGGTVLGLAGFDGGALNELADVCVVVPARSTPQVEAFHVCYHHMIAQRLRDLIGEAKA